MSTGAPAESPATPPPDCPNLGVSMVQDLARAGPNARSRFWGCQSFPKFKSGPSRGPRLGEAIGRRHHHRHGRGEVSLPVRIGSPIGTALDQRLKTTKDAISRVAMDAKTRDDELSAEFESKIGTLSRSADSHAGTMSQAVEVLRSSL
jgi:hypothetical protein